MRPTIDGRRMLGGFDLSGFVTGTAPGSNPVLLEDRTAEAYRLEDSNDPGPNCDGREQSCVPDHSWIGRTWIGRKRPGYSGTSACGRDSKARWEAPKTGVGE